MARASTRLLLVVSVIGLVILAAASVAIAVLLSGDGPPTLSQEPRWLQLKLAGSVPEAPGGDALLTDPLDMPPLRTELAAAVRHAATDPDIAGLYLRLGGTDLGWAGAQELRDALATFKAEGKPCVVYADQLDNTDYLVASACAPLHLSPTGIVLVNGLSTTRMYYAETFERYGVKANFAHVGDFKSAVEPYERTGPSEAAQQANDALLDSLYDQLIAGVAQNRGVDLAQARAWIESPPLTPQGALEAGMVDHLSYEDEVEASIGEDVEFKPFKRYLRDRRHAWGSGGDRIAVIYAEGTIIDGKSDQDLFGGRYIGGDTVAEQIDEAREDDAIKAIVLRVDSPGGSGSASDVMWRAVIRARDVKPVVVSMGATAASGGYYMSMAAHRIFAEPGTITGSIGVFGGKLNLAGLYGQIGLKLHTDQRGRYADLLSGTSDFDAEERALFQTYLSSFYETFLTKAAEGRGMERDAMHAIAQGRVWTGAQAVENGLVDELGGLDAAIAYAAAQAGVTEPALQRIPERKGMLDQLLEELTNPGGDADARVALPPEAADALGAVLRLQRAADGTGALLLLPGDLRVD